MTLKEQVDSILKSNVPNRHTIFQLNYFVIGKEPTHQAKMKRCVEELKSRKSTIESLIMEIDDVMDRNELMKLENADDEIKKRMLNRRIIQNEISIEKLKEQVKNTEEEMVFFVEAFNQLNEVEAFRDWDDIEVQTEYWNAKMLEEVNYRIMMNMPIDFEIVKTVLSLPSETPVKKKIVSLIGRNVDKMLSGK